MNIHLSYSIMGLQALVESDHVIGTPEVRVSKHNRLPTNIQRAHVSFANFISFTSSEQARAVAKLISVGAFVADFFDKMVPPPVTLGELKVNYSPAGLQIGLVPVADSKDHARLLHDFLGLLAQLTTQTTISLLHTVDAKSWEQLRALPGKDFQQLFIHSSAKSISTML